MIPALHVEIFEEQMSYTSYEQTTVFNSPSLGLLDDFLVQFERLRVPLAEGGLGDEALGVGDGGRAGREPRPRQLPPVAAEEAGPVRMAAPARAAGASASSAATAAQRPKIQRRTEKSYRGSLQGPAEVCFPGSVNMR